MGPMSRNFVQPAFTNEGLRIPDGVKSRLSGRSQTERTTGCLGHSSTYYTETIRFNESAIDLYTRYCQTPLK